MLKAFNRLLSVPLQGAYCVFAMANASLTVNTGPACASSSVGRAALGSWLQIVLRMH